MSVPEDLLAFQLKAAKILFEREFKAIPGRDFRFDFRACSGGFSVGHPVVKPVLVEVQGGIWKKGGHSSGVGITRDCEKFSLAAIYNYPLILVTPAHIKSGQALLWIEKALKIKQPSGP